MLDVIVRAISQVIANVSRDPFGGVAVNQAEESRTKPKSEEEKRGLGDLTQVAARESVIHCCLNNPRDEEVERGDNEQHQKGREYLPHVWLEKNSGSE